MEELKKTSNAHAIVREHRIKEEDEEELEKQYRDLSIH